MPKLRQLRCEIEAGEPVTAFSEYGTLYNDNYVKCHIVAPHRTTPFTIHLKSEGYTAPGLAVFVFIDGVYQCNRNRCDLKIPTPDSKRSEYEIEVILRQEEHKRGEKTWYGREWKFGGLLNDSGPKEGRIEVVVLRCHAPPQPKKFKVAEQKPATKRKEEPKPSSAEPKPVEKKAAEPKQPEVQLIVPPRPTGPPPQGKGNRGANAKAPMKPSRLSYLFNFDGPADIPHRRHYYAADESQYRAYSAHERRCYGDCRGGCRYCSPPRIHREVYRDPYYDECDSPRGGYYEQPVYVEPREQRRDPSSYTQRSHETGSRRRTPSIHISIDRESDTPRPSRKDSSRVRESSSVPDSRRHTNHSSGNGRRATKETTVRNESRDSHQNADHSNVPSARIFERPSRDHSPVAHRGRQNQERVEQVNAPRSISAPSGPHFIPQDVTVGMNWASNQADRNNIINRGSGDAANDNQNRGWDQNTHSQSQNQWGNGFDQHGNNNAGFNTSTTLQDDANQKTNANSNAQPSAQQADKSFMRPQPYWLEWFNNSLKSERSAEERAGKSTPIPNSQVALGARANYSDTESQPVYLDAMDNPYAAFTFWYQTKDAIEATLHTKVEEDPDEEKRRLRGMSKDHIIAELLKERLHPQPANVPQQDQGWPNEQSNNGFNNNDNDNSFENDNNNNNNNNGNDWNTGGNGGDFGQPDQTQDNAWGDQPAGGTAW